MMADALLFLPEITLLVAALVAFALVIFEVPYRTVWPVAAMLGAGVLAATGVSMTAEGEPFFRGIYKVDAFSQVMKLGVSVGLFLTLLILGNPGSVRARSRSDIPIFLFLGAVGLMLLVSATELLTIYVALELSAYSLYIMAALHRQQRQGGEAGVKYVLFGAASSAVSLYGISLLFAATKTTYLSGVAVSIAQQGATPMIIIAVLLVLAGLLFKLGAFPFHAWAPDAYQGAPHQAVTFIGTASKVAAVAVLVRIVALVDNVDPEAMRLMLVVLCIISMTLGNLAAIVQKDIKRLLAYSTIAHAGYILIGLSMISELGATSAMFYVLIYVPVAFAAFLVVCALGADGRNPTMSDLAGLYKRSPLLALTLLLGIFGLAGIPPTPGFSGKWFLFSAALEKGWFWLVLIGAGNATISLYYYLRILKEAYVTPPGDRPGHALSHGYAIAAGLAIGLILYTGFYPGPLWDLAAEGARVLFAG